MYKSKACTQRGGMHRRIHSGPSLTPAWTHPTCVLAECGSPESDIPCRASSATRSHLRRGAWRQPASLGDRICPGQHFSRRREEVPASLIRATESALLRSANGYPTDRENLAQRKTDPLGRRPHPRHVARGELWIVGI